MKIDTYMIMKVGNEEKAVNVKFEGDQGDVANLVATVKTIKEAYQQFL